MERGYWYAVECNALDVDWRHGSYDYEEAVKMALLHDRGDAFPLEMRPRIAVIDESGEESFCVDVIDAEDIYDYNPF